MEHIKFIQFLLQKTYLEIMLKKFSNLKNEIFLIRRIFSWNKKKKIKK